LISLTNSLYPVATAEPKRVLEKDPVAAAGAAEEDRQLVADEFPSSGW
jgi:hypothetical protein